MPATTNYKQAGYISVLSATLAVWNGVPDVSISSFSLVAATSMRLNFGTNGYSRGALILYSTSAITFVPSNGVVYSGDQTAPLKAANIDFNSGLYYDMTSLIGGTLYYFKIVPWVGFGASRQYYPSASYFNTKSTIYAEPSVAPVSFTAYATGPSTTVLYAQANANYDGMVVFRKKNGGYPTTTPVNGTVYSQVVGNNDGCAYSGICGASIETPSSETDSYYFRAYSYKGNGSERVYRTASYSQAFSAYA